VKNCGFQFQMEICNKDFVEQLKRTGGNRAKGKPTAAKDYLTKIVEEKVLSLVQAWGHLHHQMPMFYDVYEKMKKEGVTFPPPTPEDVTPIVPDERPSSTSLRRSTDDLRLPDDVKYRLDEIKSVITVLESILESLSPDELPKRNEVASELAGQAATQQTLLNELIEKYVSSDEKVVAVLFLLHERLNKVLARYNGEIVPDSRHEEEIIEEVQPPKASSSMEIPKTNMATPFELSKSPVELGLDLLAQIKSKETKKDPLLDWLLK